ncbi:hypothetical protein J6590_016476 [Homalodisca vitripennis]|nr:hypothetical protein J6590_016476 [Homalodisca vitripennis]
MSRCRLQAEYSRSQGSGVTDAAAATRQCPLADDPAQDGNAPQRTRNAPPPPNYTCTRLVHMTFYDRFPVLPHSTYLRLVDYYRYHLGPKLWRRTNRTGKPPETDSLELGKPEVVSASLVDLAPVVDFFEKFV